MQDTATMSCPHCGAANPLGQFYCHACRANVHVKRKRPTPSPSETPSGASGRHSHASDATVVRRYQSAYRIAQARLGLAAVIKGVGMVFGGLVAVVSLPQDTFVMVVGLCFAAAVALASWAYSAVVAAQGQILLATLDSAVANSPFLNDGERAEAMGLPRSVAARPASGGHDNRSVHGAVEPVAVAEVGTNG